MAEFIIPLILLLGLLALFGQESFVFTLIYIFAGTYALVRWWSRRALHSVRFERVFVDKAFPGEEIRVQLKFINSSWLPLPWLQVSEAASSDITSGRNFRQVLRLNGHGRTSTEYLLQARKRGYYLVGPLRLQAGDILGLAEEVNRSEPADRLIVFPRVIALSRVHLPSLMPIGALAHELPIFEDPVRVSGRRMYRSGDSLRRVDWKTTASSGQLQVKLFDPSIAAEIMIVLNLNRNDYHRQRRLDSTEFAIVVAASLANWAIGRKLPAGLDIYGADPMAAAQIFRPIPPGKGRGHLTHLLETLARAQTAELPAFSDHLQRAAPLAWGSTLTIVTGSADLELFRRLVAARRSGLRPALILCGPVAELPEISRQAAHFGIPLVHFLDEVSLRIWQ